MRGVLPVVGAAVRARVVEDADDGGVAAGEDAGYSAGAAAVAAAWGFVDEDFVALHGAVDLVGRDEEVVFAVGAAVGADEGVAVAVQVDASGDEVVAGGSVFLREALVPRGARAVRSGAAEGMAHCSLSVLMRSPRAVMRASCSSRRRRSRPPPRPSSRMSCL